jgi:hypothetical protein
MGLVATGGTAAEKYCGKSSALISTVFQQRPHDSQTRKRTTPRLFRTRERVLSQSGHCNRVTERSRPAMLLSDSATNEQNQHATPYRRVVFLTVLNRVEPF